MKRTSGNVLQFNPVRTLYMYTIHLVVLPMQMKPSDFQHKDSQVPFCHRLLHYQIGSMFLRLLSTTSKSKDKKISSQKTVIISAHPSIYPHSSRGWKITPTLQGLKITRTDIATVTGDNPGPLVSYIVRRWWNPASAATVQYLPYWSIPRLWFKHVTDTRLRNTCSLWRESGCSYLGRFQAIRGDLRRPSNSREWFLWQHQNQPDTPRREA